MAASGHESHCSDSFSQEILSADFEKCLFSSMAEIYFEDFDSDECFIDHNFYLPNE